jgi:hypothetical protein
MIKMTLRYARYARYALAALHAVGFAITYN